MVINVHLVLKFSSGLKV